VPPVHCSAFLLSVTTFCKDLCVTAFCRDKYFCFTIVSLTVSRDLLQWLLLIFLCPELVSGAGVKYRHVSGVFISSLQDEHNETLAKLQSVLTVVESIVDLAALRSSPMSDSKLVRHQQARAPRARAHT